MVVALSIIHLSQLPHGLCILSVLLHLNYGHNKVLTNRILHTHHPQLAAALDKFTSDGSWAPVNSIAVPYLDTDVSISRSSSCSDLISVCITGIPSRSYD